MVKGGIWLKVKSYDVAKNKLSLRIGRVSEIGRWQKLVSKDIIDYKTRLKLEKKTSESKQDHLKDSAEEMVVGYKIKLIFYLSSNQSHNKK